MTISWMVVAHTFKRQAHLFEVKVRLVERESSWPTKSLLPGPLGSVWVHSLYTTQVYIQRMTVYHMEIFLNYVHSSFIHNSQRLDTT